MKNIRFPQTKEFLEQNRTDSSLAHICFDIEDAIQKLIDADFDKQIIFSILDAFKEIKSKKHIPEVLANYLSDIGSILVNLQRVADRKKTVNAKSVYKQFNSAEECYIALCNFLQRELQVILKVNNLY